MFYVRVPYDKIREHLDFIKQHRINLEIYFNAGCLDALKPGEINELKKTLEYNPSLTVHAPFMDLSPGAVDSKVKAVTHERFSQVFEIAGTLEPKTVVFHSGYEKWKYAHKFDVWLEASIITWNKFIKRASGIGTKIVIENVFEDRPDNLKLLMQELDSEHTGICFDTGHCNLFTKEPLSVWLESLGPYIVELHLHDNDGSFDSHLPVGDGTFDFNALFSALRALKGRDILYTIESHTPGHVMKSMERLKKLIL